MKMKIKLKNPQPAPDAAAATGDPPANAPPPRWTPVEAMATGPLAYAPAPTPKINLKLKAVAAPASGDASAGDAPAADAPKPKRKYTKKPKLDENGQATAATKAAPKGKKRPHEDVEEGAPAKRKPKPTLKSLGAALAAQSDDEDDEDQITVLPTRPQPIRTSSIKLSLKTKGATMGRPPTAIIKMKPQGKPPVRPPGVGYDSEADEAEDDPAIESQFVLRMQPGPDCDLLRKAIENKTIGKTTSHGGPGVQFRFFDKEGRKAMVTIQGRMYAASMVELPCVIETLKSWNKRDWVKSADVCQMLLVLGPVQSEDEARKFTRPREIEPDSHRYPHGLTPPMQWARRRRFRPRKSYLDVERIEATTEALLAEDDECMDVDYRLVNSEDEESDEDEDDEDAPGEDVEMGDGGSFAATPAEDAVDANDLEQMFHAEFMSDDDQGEMAAEPSLDDLFGNGGEVEVETPAAGDAHEAVMQALAHHGGIAVEAESAASTPAAATSPDDDDDDDDEGEDEDEIDPEQAEQQRIREETQAEIRELEQTIAAQIEKRDATSNIPYKRKLQNSIDQLEKDKQVKMSKLGLTTED